MGNVDKLEGRNLPIEGARTVLGDDKEIEPAVAVKVGDCDPGFDRPQRELAEPVAPHPGIVEDIGHRQAGIGRR